MTYEELMEKYLKTVSENKELTSQNIELKVKVENQQLEINNLKRIIYGVKREYTPKTEVIQNGEQCSLFSDITETEEKFEEQLEQKVKEIFVVKNKKSKVQKAGIKKEILKNVEIIVKEYDITEKSNCPICNEKLKKVGKRIVRQEITYIPAKLVLTNYVQHTYKCEGSCCKEEGKQFGTFIKAKLPNPLLTHSFVSPSLAKEVIYQKYYLGVPLYRQERMWDGKGLILPRNMMANWIIKINEYYLRNLYNLMLKKTKEANSLIHLDETTIQCNKEPGRSATSQSYMWVLASGELEEQKSIIFKYSPSRSTKIAEEYISGYKGILITDGYAAYDKIEGVTHAECWAHCRRYFYESIPLDERKKMNTSSYGYKGLEYCNKLFKIEEEIAQFSISKKQEIRNKESKVILEEFFDWVNETKTEKIILNEKLAKALTYALNQKKELSEFLNDGRIPLTNSLAERAIRPFAVHRKNWLFADSVEGAHANATMYSIIESAKVNKLNIEKYIEYLLEELPQLENVHDEKALEKYLPWSKRLPEDILDFQGTYQELKIKE